MLIISSLSPHIFSIGICFPKQTNEVMKHVSSWSLLYGVQQLRNPGQLPQSWLSKMEDEVLSTSPFPLGPQGKQLKSHAFLQTSAKCFLRLMNCFECTLPCSPWQPNSTHCAFHISQYLQYRRYWYHTEITTLHFSIMKWFFSGQ